jgi:hypothetical protein
MVTRITGCNGGHSAARITNLAAAVLILFGGVACGDDPFLIRWQENPTNVTLYSLDRPELNLPSGFNFISRQAVQIESAAAAGRWDLAVDSDESGIYFLPPGALGVTSRAGIAPMPGSSFDEVREAPRDTAQYSTMEPVAIALGTTYVIRTRQEQGGFGQVCVYYAKLEPLDFDAAEGVVTFVYDASPACNNRRLVPPDS